MRQEGHIWDDLHPGSPLFGVKALVEVRRSFASGEGATLYICSTPIGNLEDATFRLIQTLREADVVLAEDTRHTRKLLTHFDVHPPLVMSYHEHNRHAREEDLLRFWREGKKVALVSDAGTPGVSDPGFEAVQLATAHHIPTVPVPGASAVLTALVGSGLPVQPFTFLGFLPREKKALVAVLRQYDGIPGSLVFYEAPHRLEKTLRQMAELWPDREVALCRELTKKYETYINGTLQDVLAYVSEEGVRGEYVVVLGPDGRSQKDEVALSDEERMEQAVRVVSETISEGSSHKEAVKKVSQELGVPRNELYQRTLG